MRLSPTYKCSPRVKQAEFQSRLSFIVSCGFKFALARNTERLGSLESSTEDCRGGARWVGHRRCCGTPDPLLLYFYDESDFATEQPSFCTDVIA